jgi:hypothetical protein
MVSNQLNQLYDITPKLSERYDIQTILNDEGKIGLFNWKESNIFGLPKYLSKARIISKESQMKVNFINYEKKIIPDCICEYQNNKYVIELKRSYKYEPLGIAEVLFNAECIKLMEEQKVIPVFIGSFNMWHRVVIHRLKKAKIDFIYYELYALSYERDRSPRDSLLKKNDFLWFYDPFQKRRNWMDPYEKAEERNGFNRITYQYFKNNDEYLLFPSRSTILHK